MKSAVRSLAIAAVVATTWHVQAARPFYVVFSASQNGGLRSCHCPDAPWGGLAKRAWMLEEIRKVVGPQNILTLDAGDLFPPEYDAERAATLIAICGPMACHAVAVGDQELAGGLDAFVKLNSSLGVWDGGGRKTAFPWLSGGYAIKTESGDLKTIGSPWKIVKIAGNRIGIVPAVSPEVFRLCQDRLAGIAVNNPTNLVRTFLADQAKNLDFVIVLSHQGYEADRAFSIAAKIDGVNLIVGGHSQTLLAPPDIVNGIALCQPGKNGENIGILALNPASSPTGAQSGKPPAPYRPADDPFQTTAISIPGWRIAQLIVPLNTAVDEAAKASRLINRYYAGLDRQAAEHRTQPQTAPAVATTPLRIDPPVTNLLVAAGEKAMLIAVLHNDGTAPLEIKKVASKAAQLKVVEYPPTIEPGRQARLQLEFAAVDIDRHSRNEYIITAVGDDRIKLRGVVNAEVRGPMSGILDVAKLMEGLRTAAGIAPESSQKPQPATTDYAARSGTGKPATGIAPVLLECFVSPGCSDCHELKTAILPRVVERFGAAVAIFEWDINIATNYMKLARYHDNFNLKENRSTAVVIDGQIVLSGLKQIGRELFPALQARMECAVPSPPAEPETKPAHQSGKDILAERFERFTVPAILVAGLIDGINPCAFATIVFFITLLAVSGIRDRKLLLVGAAYTAAVYTTYLLLGLGAFLVLQRLAAWRAMGIAIEWTMAAFLAVLAVLSFRDAWKFQRYRNARDVTLQLPDRLKQRIHRIMRERLSSRALLAGALAIGFMVTLLEAVCTGQVYLPILVCLAKDPEHAGRAWTLLILYNLMFIVPLIAVILAAFFGARNQRLLAWSARNVVWGKAALGLLFAGLCAIILLT